MKKRVNIPVNNPTRLLLLAKRIQDKHTLDGDASLLKPLEWNEFTPVLNDAIAKHERAEQLKREVKELYESRDASMKTVLSLVRRSRDVLSGVKGDRTKTLGQWGFDVFEQNHAATPTSDGPPGTSVKKDQQV